MKNRGSGKNRTTAMRAPRPVQNPASPANFPLTGVLSAPDNGVNCGRIAVTIETHAEPPRAKNSRRKIKSGYTRDGCTKANNDEPTRRYPTVATYD